MLGLRHRCAIKRLAGLSLCYISILYFGNAFFLFIYNESILASTPRSDGEAAALPRGEQPVPARQFGFKAIYRAPAIQEERPYLLVLVCSSPHDEKHRRLRQAIRETWAKPCYQQLHVELDHRNRTLVEATASCLVVFNVGRSHDNRTNELIMDESDAHGDMLIANSFDSYHNITEKLLAALQWASRLNPEYIFKTDDDIYANIGRLIAKLNWDKTLPRDLYAGSIYSGEVERDPTKVHFISTDEYPAKRYPRFCTGAGYVFRGHLLPRLLTASTAIQRLPIDDAYIGILMKAIGVRPTPLHDFIDAKWVAHFVDQLRPCEFASLVMIGDSLSPCQLRQIHVGMVTYHHADMYCIRLPGRVAMAILILMAFLVLTWFIHARRPKLRASSGHITI